ncbi:RE1 [Symbiodinium sp. CCMP2592]|nr:RE1 [Symbiodinium sp. CCMP2592]
MPPSGQPTSGQTQATEQVQGSASYEGSFKDREPPPGFDGRNPDKAFPRWLKELELWKFETEIPKKKWGVKVFRQLQGSAKSVADSLSFDELACEKGLDNLMKVLKDHYEPHLQVSLPKAFEEAIYGDIRSAKESFSDYVIRYEHSFKELQRQGVELHDLVVGYVLFRHANLSDVQEAQMLTWGAGKYDRKTVIENLRKLDKGIFDVKKKGHHYLLDTDAPENDEDDALPNAEAFLQGDDEGESDGDEDDLKDVYEEEQMMQALATYQDIRRSLREQKTNRGFYPSGKGAASSKGGKDKGKGRGSSRPMLDVKNRNREPMKFGSRGTKVHIDLLKLRTKCARCGAVGHWARECRNAPDDRGRMAMAKSPSVAQSSVSSPSTKSGFFVETSGNARSDVLFGKNETGTLMSYAPTLGNILSSMLSRDRVPTSSKNAETIEELSESFVGVSTRAGEGIVDTAAQDGLVGKAALLELTSVLREYGLQIKWNHHKQAQASGVGGRAKVVGIAEIPVGLAGVNGLLEATVVQENIPLLLPIRMLKQLKAVVDLESDRLQLKAYGVETAMHAMPSGHMSVSVTDFAAGGWRLPNAAESEHMKHEQFVLASSGFLQSMYPLEGRTTAKDMAQLLLHRMMDQRSRDANTRPGAQPAGVLRSRRAIARWRVLGDKMCDLMGIVSLRERVWEWLPSGSQRLLGLEPSDAATSPSTPTSSTTASSDKQLEYAKIIKVSTYLGQRKSKDPPKKTREQCEHPTTELKGGGNQYSKEIWCNVCKSRWASLTPDELHAKMKEINQVPIAPSMTSGSMETGQGSATVVKCQCGNPATRWEVKKDGPTKHRHFYRCRNRVCEFFQWDETEQRALKSRVRSQPGDPDEMMEIDGQEKMVKDQMEELKLQTEHQLNAQAQSHQEEVNQLKVQLAWMQSYLSQMQGPATAAGSDGFQLTESQLLNARKHQMQAFCLQASTPWSMPMSRCFYVWDELNDVWCERVGWLPRVTEGHVFMAVFEDENSMVLWSEEAGKLKALSAGERKHTMNAVMDVRTNLDDNCQQMCFEAVSPDRIHQFVEYDQAMAILDPLGAEQFWLELKAKGPSYLVLQPARDEPSLRLACEAAEWQQVRNLVFAVICEADDEGYVRKWLDESPSVYVGELTPSRRVVTNHLKMFREMEKVWCHNEEMISQNTNDLLQNPKVHRTEENKVFLNVEIISQNTDDLLQNPEVHRSYNYDVCQEHDWSPFQDVCQEHDWSQNELCDQDVYITTVQAGMIEFKAERLLTDQDFSFVSLEQLLQSMPQLVKTGRQSVMQGSYASFGLYAHGNHYGVTKWAKELPRFTEYVNQVIKYQCRCQGWQAPTWTTFAIGQNAGSALHKDNHNCPHTKNYIFALGKHQGGGLWTETSEPANLQGRSKVEWKMLPNGKRVPGVVHDIHYKLHAFDPQRWHQTSVWKGTRYVVSAFTSRAADLIDNHELSNLRKLGFSLPQDNFTYMFDGTRVPGIGPFSSVYVEDDECGPMAEGGAQDEDRGEAELVDDAVEPTAEEKRLVKKLHDNLGHPGARELARSLRLAHAKPHIVRHVAKKFVCPTCEARPKPRPARPAVLPKAYEAGKVVGVDVVFLPGLDPRQSFPALNIVDWGTNYQMVERLKNTESDHAWRTFMRTWARVFGVPEIIVADLGSEFRGQFSELAGQAGALIRHTAARSPWQAGKTERAGAHFKHVYERARDTVHVTSWEEVKTLLYEVEGARNRYGNRSGFSPMQRQIGHNLRLPGSLLSDDHLDPQLVVQSAGDEMRRTLEIRKCAQEAYVKSQTEVALSKAKNARSRIAVEFHAGETVYVYRQPYERKRRHAMTPESHEGRKPTWVGPGLVLAVEKPSLWISMKGELWKASFEQCRHATSEEQIAKEMLAGELEALREELSRTSTKRTYRDMTGMGVPEDDLDDDGGEARGGALGPVLEEDERPAQRPRVEEAVNVPIPEDDDEELDYSPSEVNDDPVGEAPQLPQSERQRTESEPEPLPTPRLSEATARTVMRNEVLDGNFPGSPSYEAVRKVQKLKPRNEPYFERGCDEKGAHQWYCLEDGQWKPEQDEWEFVSPDVVIRRHNVPRSSMCNPGKIRKALLPRRLKVRQTYMVMDDGTVDKSKDFWFKQRKSKGSTTKSWTGFTVFSNKEVNIENFVVGKARGQGEVYAHEIKEDEWPEWRKTDKGEWDKVLGTGAIRILDLEESRKIRNSEERHRIIPSRMVRRWKPGDQPGSPPTRKSRWCLRGDKDPDLLELDRHAPTLNTTSFGVLLQVASSMRYAAAIGDLKNAFCQSLPLHRRQGKLYASLPKEGIDGLHEEQLVEVVAGVYGLGDSPQHWRKTLRDAILGLGYRESQLDPTVYLLQTGDVLDGAIAVEVDDLFTFGNGVHTERMNKLREKFQFGKFEDVMSSPTGVAFNGRRIKQLPNFEFEIDMCKFVEERLSPVQLSKGRKACAKSLANDSEVNQMRAVVGALNWLAKEGRPDAAAAASLGASTFPKPTVQDVIDINRAVALLKERPELKIKIRSIAPENLSWGVVSDASFANAYAGHSQGAYAILAFDDRLKDGYRVPCSMIAWRSGRIQKVVNSTLAAETQSLSKGLGELCWVATLFNELMDVNFKISEWESRLQGNRVVTMAPEDSSEELKGSLCIVDAKALYDHLSKETAGPSSDKRTGLEIQVIRQNMSSINSEIRWVPHPHMVVDGLTKKAANMTALYDLLESGEYQIVNEASALQEKKNEREIRGYNKR